jgi:hypothetical protein
MKYLSQSPGNRRSTPESALHVLNLIDLLALYDSVARLTRRDVICRHKFTDICPPGNAGNAGNAASSELSPEVIHLNPSDLNLAYRHAAPQPTRHSLPSNMTSRKTALQPETANATTAADEINRFVRYVDFRTRDLRETFATLLGTNSPSNTVTLREEDDEDLFLDVGPTEEGWVDVHLAISDCILHSILGISISLI